MLYKEVLFKWLEIKKLEIRGSSAQNYLQCTNNWIIPILGNIPIDNITKYDLQNFIIDFAKKHRRNTVINISKPLSGSFKWAEENGFINVSPWKNIKIPKDYSEKEILVFSQEEIEKVFENPEYVDAGIPGEMGFITDSMTEESFAEKKKDLEILSVIRMGM